MNKTQLYPLTFKPQLKEKIWGGNALVEQFGKEGAGKIGESWEISGVENNISLVDNGIYRGKSLTQLTELYGSELVGSAVVDRFGDQFPLLFKFIHASEDLSVQLHPDDEVASRRHNSFGKTEMWYIMQAEEEARLILGFDGDIDQASYSKYLSEGKITKILHAEKVKKGDAFFIAPGTVHAIGAGIVLAEIQQTSDITYRIYDWDRPGIDGNMRELHTEEALDVINFNALDTKLYYDKKKDEVVSICQSPYFETNVLELSKSFTRDLSGLDSFVVYMCVDGSAMVNANSATITLKRGATVLIPAAFSSIEFDTQGCTLLEVYVP